MIELLVPQASSYAADIDGLITLITVLVGFWFVLAEGIFFYFIFRSCKFHYLPFFCNIFLFFNFFFFYFFLANLWSFWPS